MREGMNEREVEPGSAPGSEGAGDGPGRGSSRGTEPGTNIERHVAKLQQALFDTTLHVERERRQVAVALHDRIGQALALAQIKLSMVHAAPADEKRAVEEAIELIAQAVTETRALSFELSPPLLYDLGVEEAIRWLVEEVERRNGLKVELSDDGAVKPLDESTASFVFRAVRELLKDVLGSGDLSRATVSLRRSADQFEVTVQDGGGGLEPESHAAAAGAGLFVIQETIDRLGGTVTVASTAGEGTSVTLRVPIATGREPERAG